MTTTNTHAPRKGSAVGKSARREAARLRRRRERRGRLMLVAGALAVIAVVVLVGLGAALRGGEEVGPRAAAPAEGRFLGSTNAPLLLSVWEDYQCRHCKSLNDDALRRIVADYVTSGKVRIVFRNYAFLGSESILAAEAAEAANEQGKFWEFHDALFARQAGVQKGVFTRAQLNQIAESLGLDMAAFNAALDSGKYRQLVLDETAEGKRLGVDSTPTIFVGDTKVEGALPYERFQALIEAALLAR